MPLLLLLLALGLQPPHLGLSVLELPLAHSQLFLHLLTQLCHGPLLALALASALAVTVVRQPKTVTSGGEQMGKSKAKDG